MGIALAACVDSLRSSNTLLSSSIGILDNAVNDFPRLQKVLQSTRHFDLLPESQLKEAQRSVVSTLTPELEMLLARVDAHVQRLSRREQALIARSQLLEGRIGEERRASSHMKNSQSPAARSRRSSAAGLKAEGREALKLKALIGKKERLQYAVERLTLQAGQRQRQLRMSIANT